MPVLLPILAFLPILVTLVLMMVFKWPARWCLLISWVLAGIFAFFFFDINFIEILATSTKGMLSSFDVIIIIVGALFLMNTLKGSGATAAINRGFKNICPDKRVQACIIGFAFCSFIEAAAGFGTPAALAGPLLVSLGFPPMAAAMITLIFDSTAVSTGAVGTPITQALTMLGLTGNAGFTSQFALWTALPHAIMSLLLPLIVLMMTTKFFSNDKSFKPALKAAPFAIFTGLTFAVPLVLVSLFLSYEFASLLASLISILLTVIAAKKGFLVPKETWTFGNPDSWDKDWLTTSQVSAPAESTMSVLKAWIPYVLVALILVLTRIPALGIKGVLNGNELALSWNGIFGVKDFTTGTGTELSWSLKWAYLPGTFFILVAVITFFIHKMKKEKIKDAVVDTGKQVWGAAVALLFGIALVEIMKFTPEGGVSMMTTIANALSNVPWWLYIVICPFIGVLGAFVSGSATVSMTLFTNLQFGTASKLGLNPIFVISMQCVGAAIGNMVCINNAVAASATIGVTGREGKLIKINAIPMIIYSLVTALFFMIIILCGVNPTY
ncbi:MAG: L-lactate permease [Clostridia bacterium]|nr:L-lactate permease [Clostridia bacterium]